MVHRRVRLLVFHGYLLRGTGSNVYNANLAAALVRAGHEVHLFCQDLHAHELAFVDAVGTWRDSTLEVEVLREPVRCTAYRPDIGSVLPVYVADRYEGFEARPFSELADADVEDYVGRNVAAVRDVVARSEPEGALANHLVMGPAILARALSGTGIGLAVKVHGSALEYTVKQDARFLPYAREGIDAAGVVLVGSHHTGQSLWAALEDPSLPARTRLGPPGVDVEVFVPRDPEPAADGVRRLAAALRARGPGVEGHGSFAREPAAAAAAIEALRPGEQRLVIFVGKLIVSKGIDLLLAAWPLVLARVPDAQLVVVGFGAWREQGERMVRALASGDAAALGEIVEEGRAAEGGPREPLSYLRAFFAGRGTEPDYLRAAGVLEDRVLFTGRLEHEELAELLPAAEALVVPSTFPEAFGMVAAEAAACAAFPVGADHSGLAEVAAQVAENLAPEVRSLLSFELGEGAVADLADCVAGWLESPAEVRARAREALVATARHRFSWDGVARGVEAAVRGDLEAPALRPLE
jgi:glycosyltransferase involved in cell wall biosynthesis